MNDTHDCPGGCGARVPRHQLACKPCWWRLPGPLRDDVNAGYRKRRTDPGPHRQALREAMLWYRVNPLEVRPHTDGDGLEGKELLRRHGIDLDSPLVDASDRGRCG